MVFENLARTACPGERLLIGSNPPEENWSYRIQRVFFGLVFGTLFRATATGRRYVPLEGPVIVAANHASLVDPPMIGLMCPRPVVTLAKQELWRVPVLRQWLDSLGAVAVNRGSADLAALRAALEVVKKEKALLLFPEGTRTSDGKMAPIRRGVGWIACRSRAIVVPTFIEGSYQAFSRHRRIPRPSRITVHFGEPLLPPEDTRARKEDVDEITRQLDESMRAMEKRYLAASLQNNNKTAESSA